MNFESIVPYQAFTEIFTKIENFFVVTSKRSGRGELN